LVPLTSGEIRFRGVPLSKLPARERGSLHKRIQFIFQNPESALNPRKRIAEILARPLLLYQLVPRSQVKERVRELLAMVQLRPEYAQRFPHELSGGEKQRIGIARAFAAEPEIIIADEPLSALDVSVQASVLQLLGELQARFGTAFVFISHDLNVVRALCERVCVMYLGNLYEIGTTDEVFLPPYHPYTEALLSAIPVPDPSLHRERVLLIGPPPSPRHPPSGCRFHTRCPRKWGSICEQQMPPAQELAPGHLIFCHRPPDLLPREDLLPVAEPATAERSEPTVTGSTTYNDRPADKL
jgi:oligopeptide/dipeptide ABC transporter ATP-binding protein